MIQIFQRRKTTSFRFWCNLSRCIFTFQTGIKIFCVLELIGYVCFELKFEYVFDRGSNILRTNEPTRKNRPIRFISPHHRVNLQLKP